MAVYYFCIALGFICQYTEISFRHIIAIIYVFHAKIFNSTFKIIKYTENISYGLSVAVVCSFKIFYGKQTVIVAVVNNIRCLFKELSAESFSLAVCQIA